jgi:DNA (cytosine-5)-methyltransferase 1
MKLNERGRGKFKPSPDYSVDDVRSLLFQKIDEERQNFESSSHSIDFNHLSYKEDKLNMLSLFSGCGGLDLGFELAGLQSIIGENKALECFKDKQKFKQYRSDSVFHTIYANDFFPEATQSYSMNFPAEVCLDTSDIRKIKDFPKADIVLGGFPCPGFSEAGPRLIDDERDFLYLHFIRCLMQSKPYVFVAENVKGMMTLGKGEVFKQIVQDFSVAGYTVYHKLLDAKNYGVPQTRERVLLIGVRDDISFIYNFPDPTHGSNDGKDYVTLKDAIFDLNEDPGAFFTGSYSTIFMSRNRKKTWAEPSFTIQASGRQAPIHPGGDPMQKLGKDEWEFIDGIDNNRRFSVKEIARIQTFPDWYQFSDGKNDGNTDNARLDKIYKQIGNAVPVMLAYAIAKPISDWAVEFIRNNKNIRCIPDSKKNEESA